MRRTLTGLLVAAAIVALALIMVARASHERPYRVDVVFDTAKGIVPGQLVKVAGVPVGTVKDVRLTARRKAMLTLGIDEGFRPFHRDATCRIRPEGFISENFVECDAGSLSAPPLDGPHGVPTVPVEQTAIQVSLQDLVETFAAPTPSQLTVLLNELGIATAGRGSDLNAILRRANPALQQAQRVLRVVDRQRRDVRAAIADTDTVLHRLAVRDHDVRSFVAHAATVTATTAGHDADLRQAIRQLPALLAQTRPALRSLDRASDEFTPLADDLRGAAPALTRVAGALPQFSAVARPVLRRLGDVLGSERPTVRALRPTARAVADVGRRSGPLGRDLAALLLSTRDSGGGESALRIIYGLAIVAAAHDNISHMLSLSIGIAQGCLADKSAAGCDHRFSAAGEGTVLYNAPATGAHDLGESVGRGRGVPTQPPLTPGQQRTVARKILEQVRR